MKTEHARLKIQVFHNNCRSVRKSNSGFRDIKPALVTCKSDLSTSFRLNVRSWMYYIFLVCILVFEAIEDIKVKFKPTKMKALLCPQHFFRRSRAKNSKAKSLI